MRVVPVILLAVLLLSPAASLAQTPEQPAIPHRAFVDLTLLGMISSHSGSRTFTGQFVTFGEAGSSHAIYPRPGTALQLPSIDVGAGYMTGTSSGVGINFSRMSFDDAVRVATSVPHPEVVNAAGVAQGVTGRELSRKETSDTLMLRGLRSSSNRTTSTTTRTTAQRRIQMWRNACRTARSWCLRGRRRRRSLQPGCPARWAR